MRSRSWIACLALAAAIPLTAAAEQAFTVRDVEVFAGPSSEYPPIAQLPPNTAVDIAGCLSDWSWCDVVFARDRGWVYAGDLVVPFQGSRVVIIEYGPRIHLPVVTFTLVTYWDQHYRSRPFYRERQQWVSRVRIEANHGGRAPAGHERAAQQSTPSPQPQPAAPETQAQRRPAPDRAAARAERSAPPADSASSSEAARTARQTQQAKASQPSREARARSAQPQVAQSPQSEQPRVRDQRKAPEAQPPQAGKSQEGEQRPQQISRAPQPSRTEPGSRPTRPQEAAPPREAGRAQHEEKGQKEQQSGSGQ